jgi:hypothetical protein
MKFTPQNCPCVWLHSSILKSLTKFRLSCKCGMKPYLYWLFDWFYFGCMCIIKHSSRRSKIYSSISSKRFILETVLFGTNLSHVITSELYLKYSYVTIYLPNTNSTYSYFVVCEGWYLCCDKFYSVCSKLTCKMQRTHLNNVCITTFRSTLLISKYEQTTWEIWAWMGV